MVVEFLNISFLNSKKPCVFLIKLSLNSFGARRILSFSQVLLVFSFDSSIFFSLSLCVVLLFFQSRCFLLLSFDLRSIFLVFNLLFNHFIGNEGVEIAGSVWVFINSVFLFYQFISHLVQRVDVSIVVVSERHSGYRCNQSNVNY